MSLKNCPFCGTKLFETTYGRLHCPNHGIIEEPKEPEDKDKTPSYIN